MYQETENPVISRHFADLGDRQIHFRLAGSGPPAVLLHQSPTSSAEMATDIEAGAAFFTVIAIDMPGYGQSDPLPDDCPDVAAFARDVERVISLLGIERIVLYGFHTGGVVAFEFARLFPERCAGVVVNGLVCIEGEELDDLLRHYNVLPQITAEGSHLPWLWARLRDQTLFFPWYRKTRDARMALDLHNGEYLHPYLVDFLRAKQGGRPGYQAAFSYPTRDRAPAVDVPVLLINFEPDPLSSHPERLPGFPDCVERRIFDDFHKLHYAALAWMQAHAPAPVNIARESVGEFGGRFRKAMVMTPAGPVFVRYSAPAEGRPVVLLHDAGSSSASLEPLADALATGSAASRPIISIDLPGHGETGPLQLPIYSADAIAILVAIVLRELGITAADVVAVGAGALIASALAHPEGFPVGRLVLVDAWFFREAERLRFAASYAPKLMPGDYGQHLLEAWYFARDSELYWPWNEPQPGNALSCEPDLEPRHIHARTIDVLKAGIAFPRLVRELLTAECERPFAAVAADIYLCARAGRGHEARLAAAAGLNPRAGYRTVPADPAGWAAAVVEVLKLPCEFGHNTATEDPAPAARK